VVFADAVGGLVYEILSDIGDALMQPADPGLRFLPVIREFLLASQPTLPLREFLACCSSGAHWPITSPLDIVTKLTTPQSTPTSEVLGCITGSTSHSVWMETKTLPATIDTVTFFGSPSMSRDFIDEAARTGKASQVAKLFAIRQGFELVALHAQHGSIVVGLWRDIQDFCHGRHSVFAMHVHLVYSKTKILARNSARDGSSAAKFWISNFRSSRRCCRWSCRRWRDRGHWGRQ